MLTHEEELVLSPKRTSSIMLTLFKVIRREQFARVAPFMLKTHIFLVLFIFLPSLLANSMPEMYLSDN